MTVKLADFSADFGKAAGDYRRHRAGFPPELIVRLQKQYGLGLRDQRVLDLGTGTGTLARQFAQAGCDATGLDISAAMVDQACQLDVEEGVAVEYYVGKAEELPFPAGEFDVVIAGQCWHWFDRAKTAAAARRVLKRKGALVIAHFDWIPLDDNLVAATEALIVKHNPDWKAAGGMGMHPQWMADVTRAGFSSRETFSFDIDVPYTHEGWLGRIRASAGIGASLSPEKVAAFNAEHTALLKALFPVAELTALHRVWALVALTAA